MDLAKKRPQLQVWPEAEKGTQDRKLQLTPDFATWLLATPTNERSGPVFTVTRPDGARMRRNDAGRVISAIEKRAGIIVNNDAKKYASAHDLRRYLALVGPNR